MIEIQRSGSLGYVPATSEAEWKLSHPAPPWLPSFERTAISVIGADAAERVEGERLLKEWVKQQASPLEELLRVIQTTQDVQVIFVAVLLCRNTAFKMWARCSEGGKQFLLT